MHKVRIMKTFPCGKSSDFIFIATLICILLFLFTLAMAFSVPQKFADCATYPDTEGKPADIREAIDYVTGKGYMSGASDGKFYPDEPLNRMDYAKAVVLIFGHGNEKPDESTSFTDLEKSDSGYLYVNLAVKYGFLSAYPDGTFRPKEYVTTCDALAGLVRGLGLLEQVRYVNGLFPDAPPYAGSLIIAHDLHLKYRDTRVLPQNNYPRGEFAFSLERTEKVDQWRLDYIREYFDWLNCQTPLLGSERYKALKSAFAKVGYPYVWGGESDAEGGYDCSGLTYYVLSSVLGYPMMRTADDQSRDNRYRTVSRAELLPGDPIFFFKDASDPSYVGHAALYIGHGLFIHSTGSNSGVSVDALTGYWDENFAWGKRVLREGEPKSFDTYILLFNPGTSESQARLTYMLLDGRTFDEYVEVPPMSRRTVRIDDLLYSQDVSTLVQATGGELVCERSMYFSYKGKYEGGHASCGVQTPAKDWFLPEGCTAYGFDTYILVQNPSDSRASVTFEFMKENGSVQSFKTSVEAHSRYTLSVDTLSGMEASEFSTYVSSDVPVIAERSMYFRYGNVIGGHNSPGSCIASNNWYFSEGYTADAFDTYFLIQNPTYKDAEVTLTLYSNNGAQKSFKFVVGKHSRKTIHADDLNGFSRASFGAQIHSEEAPVVAERAMYFVYKNDISDGHVALGLPSAKERWYIAEGYTASGFDTYVLVSNPSDRDANVVLDFMTESGKRVEKKYLVKSRTRLTVCLNEIKELAGEEVSTLVESDTDIVVEGSLYCKYHEIPSGLCSPGVTETSKTWYFAEGYTGL